MKHKVSELEGARLDAAVALAHGFPWAVNDEGCAVQVSLPKYSDPPIFGSPGAMMDFWKRFNPSSDWCQGGPIIETGRIAILSSRGNWLAGHPVDVCIGAGQSGHTPLIAAMRAFVQSKLGDEVEL